MAAFSSNLSNKELNDKVCEIIRKDEDDKFKKLIENAVIDIDFRIDDDIPLAVFAARFASEKVFFKLQQMGADLTKKAKQENIITAACCCYTGKDKQQRLNITRAAIAAGVDVNDFAKVGMPALHRAALCKFDEMIAFLCDNGADINVLDSSARTTLDLYVEFYQQSIPQKTMITLLQYRARSFSLISNRIILIFLIDNAIFRHDDSKIISFLNNPESFAKPKYSFTAEFSLKFLAAEVVIKHKPLLFSKMSQNSSVISDIAESFPKLEIDPIKIFKRKIKYEIDKTKLMVNSVEWKYACAILDALSQDKPYNIIHGIIKNIKDILEKTPEVFEDEKSTKELWGNIINHMWSYKYDKEEYSTKLSNSNTYKKN